MGTAKKEPCWEKLEVSSGTYRKGRLTDGSLDTYWESSGRSGSHWVRLTIKKGTIIRSEDRLTFDL